MSTLPPDIARLKYPWRRRASDAWTDAALRGRVLTFLNAFLDNHPWARGWEVTERFADTAHTNRASSINVRKPRTPPVQPAEGDDFKQRDGVRLLILAVVRERDGATFETGLSFPLGNATPTVKLDSLFNNTRLSFEQQNRDT